MVLSVIFNAVMMFSYVVTLLFCVGDFETLASTSLPIIEIYHRATGSKGAAVTMTLLQCLVGLVSMFNMLASVSRLTWVFARDKGLSYSTFFSKVRIRH